MNLWTELRKLEGHTLKTLDKGNPFDVIKVSENEVIVRPQVRGVDRSIKGSIFDDAFTEMRNRGQIFRTEIRDKYSSFNPAYVAAILGALPGVETRTKPIQLLYKE